MKEREYRLNCWEFKKCGRQPGGEKEKELGRCPASAEVRLDGVHNGVNAGRACWVVAGTHCGGKTQGTYAMKFENCEQCDFYQKVKNEEFVDFEFSIMLLKRLREPMLVS